LTFEVEALVGPDSWLRFDGMAPVGSFLCKKAFNSAKPGPLISDLRMYFPLRVGLRFSG
jgi:hypothetical protein